MRGGKRARGKCARRVETGSELMKNKPGRFGRACFAACSINPASVSFKIKPGINASVRTADVDIFLKWINFE
jgi:hypothetical protein